MNARPLVIAHRGASGYRPEHTAAAFELAIRQGADALEPDLVATRDGVLVIRHENEISGTTDVASRSEFADRRATKIVDGVSQTGWFTEDFDWSELATLRARERLPRVRPANTRFDGEFPILRLADLLIVLDSAPRPLVLVAELKHAAYFESLGLPLDELFAAQIGGWATSENLVVESFESTVLGAVRERGVPGKITYLLEDAGTPPDLAASLGANAPSYAEQLTDRGLAALAADVDGVSVNLSLILDAGPDGDVTGTNELVERVHAAGLEAYCWTLRAENAFLPSNLRIGSDPAALGDWRAAFALVMRSGIDGVFADQPDLALEARAAG